MTLEQEQILLALKTWRKDKANEMQQPEFMLFPNATLVAIAKEKPLRSSDLSLIKGVTHTKLQRYGDDVLAICNAF